MKAETKHVDTSYFLIFHPQSFSHPQSKSPHTLKASHTVKTSRFSRPLGPPHILHYIMIYQFIFHVDIYALYNYSTFLWFIPACYVHILYLGTDNFSTQSVTKRKNGPEPEFNETFIFTMGHDEIPQVGISFSLKTGNTVVGWFSLGRNYSGTREERQWNALCENSDVTVRQWQRLISAS